MDTQLREMLIKIGYFDALVGFIMTMVVAFVSSKYAWVFLFGIAIAAINFSINGVLTDLFSRNNQGNLMLFTLLSLIIRVVVVGVIGLVLFTYNQFNVLFFMFGYSSHFIGLILYALTIKSRKGSD